MSVFSAESLSLLLPTLFAFKLVPTSAGYGQAVSNTLKLVAILGIGGIFSIGKWYVTGVASHSLFSLLFPIGLCFLVVRFLFAYGFLGSYHKVSADPVCLLVQVMLGLVLAMAAAMYQYDSVLTESLLVSNNTVFFLLLLFFLLFRCMFAYHELLDAKYFFEPSSDEIIASCLQGYKPLPTTTTWGAIVCKILLAGLSPIYLVILVGIISIIPLYVVGVTVGLVGIIMAADLSEFWLVIESFRQQSTGSLGIKFSILVTPYVGLTLLSIINAVSIGYESFVSSPVSASGILSVVPDKTMVRQYSDFALSLWLFVLSIQTITTIGYKRLVQMFTSRKRKNK